MLRVPAGCIAERYTTGLKCPTAMALGPDGRLYVAQETVRSSSSAREARSGRVEPARASLSRREAASTA